MIGSFLDWLDLRLGRHLRPLLEENPPVTKRARIFWATFVIVLYALLWSPWWYPLSDSALYLTLARALAHGHGYTNMGEMHQLARPLVPYLLAGIIKLGGGIGAMQAAMTALMLLAHLLIFRTLRRWLPERVALIATLGSAASYWVYLNAMTIMTEPLFLVMFWGGLLAMSHVPGASHGRQWLCMVIGLLLMVGAWDTRIAVAEMLPGVAIGLWLMTRQTAPVGRRLLWLAMYGIVFGALIFQYLPARPGNFKFKLIAMISSAPAPATGPATAAAVVDNGGEEDSPKVRTEHYRFLFLHDIKNPFVELPITGGRWVCEGLAAATEYVFPKFASSDTSATTRPIVESLYPDPKADVPDASSKLVRLCGGIFAGVVMLLFVIGWLGLLARRSWWVAAVALYFIPIWLQWGERLKPRYMIPIAPLLFILLWAGIAIVLRWIAERWSDTSIRQRGFQLGSVVERQSDKSSVASVSLSPDRGSGIRAGVVLLGIVFALNAPPYAVEFYLRHLSHYPFYSQVRRGAFRELVDISDYVQAHADPQDEIWVNHGAMRRVIALMSGRRVEVFETFAPTNGRGTRLTGAGRDFLNHIPLVNHRQYAIVFSDRFRWPEWHLPLEPRPHETLSWWTLWEHDPGGNWHTVKALSTDGQAIRGIPPSDF